ncbi:MAG: CPBP family intramembrane glutamic endopeptidase, partial [Bacteroidota bacterium]
MAEQIPHQFSRAKDQIGHRDEVSLPLPSVTALVMLLLLILLCSLIGSALVFGLGQIQNLDYGSIFYGLAENNNLQHRNFIRSVLMINHCSMFILPGLLFGLFLYRQRWRYFFHLQQAPPFQLILITMVWIIVAFPLVQLSFWLNQQIPLPDWAQTMEDSSGGLIKAILVAEAPFELLFNLIIIALLPSIGEELIFRGILQQHLAKVSKSMGAGIWLSAFLFSTMHLQFEGFLPRMLLGVLLGYLFYWTANLWLPIIAHFFYNGSQVLGQYWSASSLPDLDLEQANQVSWPLSLFSIIFVLAIGYYLFHYAP